MATVVRDLSTPRYAAVAGQPPPLHTMATPVPPSTPMPAHRPGTSGGTPALNLPTPVGQVDPSDSTTWPSPDAIQFS